MQHYPDRVKRARAAGLLALAALAGCSLGDEGRPRQATGAAREVEAVVERLERAVAAGDWAAICNELFTPDARRRAGGADCQRLLRSDAAGVRAPRIELVSIELERGRALARVRSRARGQPPLGDTIELRRTEDGYRVQALSR
jgi:hypothetical protein